MALAYPKGKRRAAQRKLVRSATMPAPVRGLRASDAIMGIGNTAEAALVLNNLIPRELGGEVRPGSVTVATKLPSVANPDSGEVRTIIGFEGLTGSLSKKRFAATDLGIFDITAESEGPWTEVYSWINTGGDAGWCSYISFTNVNGDPYILLCDEQNGYIVYDGLLGTWAPGSTGAGDPGPEEFVQITEWQNRIWLVQRDTASAWYSGIGAISGDFTEIDLGSRFLKGGFLVQLESWSFDDGSGLNDRLLAMSSAGDVLAFSGIDPGNASQFEMDGRWFVGSPPKGRRVMSDWGGDVMILSSFGLITASVLATTAEDNLNSDLWASKHIARYFRAFMNERTEFYGWSMELAPLYGVGIFTIPQLPGFSDAPIQFCLNANTNAWCMFKNLDMRCANKDSTGFYFGTTDGRVLRLEGHVDNVGMTIEAEPNAGDPISWQTLTHYDPLGNPAIEKMMQFIRPYFIGGAAPSYNVRLNFDFDLNALDGSPQSPETGLALWDEALWDEAAWAGAAQNYESIRGVSGMGRQIAVTMIGESTTELSLLGYDLMYTDGGLL